MSSNQLTLRFSKKDVYGNYIFVASEESSNPAMVESFNTLSKYQDKLQSVEGLKSFLPIYSKETFSSIRFKKNYKIEEFVKNSIYSISFDVRIVEREGVKFCNCFISDALLLETPVEIDRGELFTL
jgi:hypothetical protein